MEHHAIIINLSCIIFIFMCISIEISAVSLSFTIGTEEASLPLEGPVVGYDVTTNTTLLYGGHEPRQLTKFKDHAFFGDVTTHLSHDLYAAGKCYIQLNNTLWTITEDGSDIISIDLTTSNERPDTITIPINVGFGACLTSINHYLIVVGGGTWSYEVALDIVQIYDMNTQQWLANIPSLGTPRMSVSCVIVNHLLYVVGGWKGDIAYIYLDTIETLDVSDMSSIQTQRWQYLNATLNTARGGTRAVLHGSDIVIIGGQDNYMRRTADVNIIDTNAVQRYIGGQLAFATCYASTIILGNILYVFGGMGNTGLEKRYQYATMPTGTSTTYPTHNPSSNPTNIPSQYPTF
eukprot:102680_1